MLVARWTCPDTAWTAQDGWTFLNYLRLENLANGLAQKKKRGPLFLFRVITGIRFWRVVYNSEGEKKRMSERASIARMEFEGRRHPGAIGWKTIVSLEIPTHSSNIERTIKQNWLPVMPICLLCGPFWSLGGAAWHSGVGKRWTPIGLFFFEACRFAFQQLHAHRKSYRLLLLYEKKRLLLC